MKTRNIILFGILGVCTALCLVRMLFILIDNSINQSIIAYKYVNFNTEFERIGIGEANMSLPMMRSGTRIKGDLVMYNGLLLYPRNLKSIKTHINPAKNVLRSNKFQLWQLQTPFWLEKNAFSDTVFVYCGTDTLYVLLTEIP